ncbi:MAG: TetR/AcrR family transcriptional regulator [Chloroflexi bacterium]|nr:TetR/AcrR family transcriptional regulator [Chloroflexota bacterium]
MARGPYQQKQWDEREAAILDTLETLSAERAFDSITMDELAAAVGISKATLYQHFDSKEALLVRLVARHEDRFLRWLDDTQDLPPLEHLLHVLRYLTGGHIVPLGGQPGGSSALASVFRTSTELIERHDQIIRRLYAIIQQGQAQHSITPDLAPESIISAMLALSNVSMGDYEPLAWIRQIASRDDYVEQLVRVFERAIRLD